MKWLLKLFSKFFNKENNENTETGEIVAAALTNSEAYENYKKVIEIKNQRIKSSTNYLQKRIDEKISDAVSENKLSATTTYKLEDILEDEIIKIYLDKGYKVKVIDNNQNNYNSDDKRITVSWDHFKC